MSAVPSRAPPAGIPAELARDIGAEICRRLSRGEGVAGALELERLVASCDDERRRRELTAFIERVDAVPESARGDFAVAMHPVQVRSKLWLIDELAARHDLRAQPLVVLGAWYGVLPRSVNWRLSEPPRRMICVDLEPGRMRARRRDDRRAL